ncbi:MAG: biopolymer transporter ExbD [Proteobacteria bacterium]|jgi:biopolymer transport protein ExbD|nr:biopolymer transporter ExbD [Pseudomonadota bacterium]
MDTKKSRSGTPTVEEMDRQRRADKKALMRLRARIDAEDVNFLNITAMMDMMTILLVFMLISFSSESANITQSDQLRLASSGTAKEVVESVSVTLTKSAILVEGNAVADVHDGAIDASDKQSGDVNGLVITPLLDALVARAELDKKIAEMKGEMFEGAATIIADKATPYRLLTEVMYTAGEAQYKKYRLIVLQKKQ